MQLNARFPLLSILWITCKDWKFNKIPSNRYLAQKIFNGENICSLHYLLDFSRKTSCVTPPLHVHNASQFSFDKFFNWNFG
jgi:hypothetical protein